MISDPYQRPLIDRGVLVGSSVFDKIVDIHAYIPGTNFVVIYLDYNARRIDSVDNASALCHYHDPRVGCDSPLHASAYEWLFAEQSRHRLTLHVRAH